MCWGRVSHFNTEIAELASLGVLCLLLPSAGITSRLPCWLSIGVGAKDPECRPHSHMADTLPTEASSSPLVLLCSFPAWENFREWPQMLSQTWRGHFCIAIKAHVMLNVQANEMCIFLRECVVCRALMLPPIWPLEGNMIDSPLDPLYSGCQDPEGKSEEVLMKRTSNG